MSKIEFPFPIFITKEGKWFVAACPILGIATQGKTEEEVKENIEDLIKEYLKDPNTLKPKLKELSFSSLSYISVKISKSLLYGKTPAPASK
ncbi:type II toxin-antitoxin system HicB family antitoxin [Patescibacteria group bacterium]|nr:type II toxin-antitoxin system HicB family antitoxin [Patescibacteria group bacterium]